MAGSKRIQHRSIRGVPINMDELRSNHENLRAMGNANMNARGDVLGPTGNILVKREQIIQAYNKSNPQGVRQVSLKDATPDTFETPKQAMDRLAQEAINRAKVDEPKELMGKRAARKLLDKTD